jgi:cytochrome P450
MSSTTDKPVPSISSFAFWSKPSAERAVTFAELRRDAPVSFQEPSDFGLSRANRGFWAVTSHADVQHVSRTPTLFCSSEGVGMGAIPKEMLELNASFLVMDDPKHAELRRIVSGVFTPKQVARLSDEITTEANSIVDEFVDSGGGDVVHDFAMKLPLWTISNMMGVPPSLRMELVRAAEGQIAAQDPEFKQEGRTGTEVAIEAGMTMHAIAHELIAERRGNPGDDILSKLVHSELDGEPLSDAVLGGVFVLFATAGNDTTRTTSSHGVKLLADNEAQWAAMCGEPELVNSAVEEMVRFVSPVIHFRRTATEDTVLGGVDISEGDAVVLFYESANHDGTVFERPERFDVRRSPNPHVGFGGGGSHFCLGANLARVQLRALFGRLAERAASLEVGTPDYLISNFSHAIKRMPVTITPRARMAS